MNANLASHEMDTTDNENDSPISNPTASAPLIAESMLMSKRVAEETPHQQSLFHPSRRITSNAHISTLYTPLGNSKLSKGNKVSSDPVKWSPWMQSPAVDPSRFDTPGGIAQALRSSNTTTPFSFDEFKSPVPQHGRSFSSNTLLTLNRLQPCREVLAFMSPVHGTSAIGQTWTDFNTPSKSKARKDRLVHLTPRTHKKTRINRRWTVQPDSKTRNNLIQRNASPHIPIQSLHKGTTPRVRKSKQGSSHNQRRHTVGDPCKMQRPLSSPRLDQYSNSKEENLPREEGLLGRQESISLTQWDDPEATQILDFRDVPSSQRMRQPHNKSLEVQQKVKLNQEYEVEKALFTETTLERNSSISLGETTVSEQLLVKDVFDDDPFNLKIQSPDNTFIRQEKNRMIEKELASEQETQCLDLEKEHYSQELDFRGNTPEPSFQTVNLDANYLEVTMKEDYSDSTPNRRSVTAIIKVEDDGNDEVHRAEDEEKTAHNSSQELGTKSVDIDCKVPMGQEIDDVNDDDEFGDSFMGTQFFAQVPLTQLVNASKKRTVDYLDDHGDEDKSIKETLPFAPPTNVTDTFMLASGKHIVISDHAKQAGQEFVAESNPSNENSTSKSIPTLRQAAQNIVTNVTRSFWSTNLAALASNAASKLVSYLSPSSKASSNQSNPSDITITTDSNSTPRASKRTRFENDFDRPDDVLEPSDSFDHPTFRGIKATKETELPSSLFSKSVHDTISAHSEPTSEAPAFGGFSKASGKPLATPSKEAQKKEQVIIQHRALGPNEDCPDFESSLTGFSTGSGKPLAPPSAAAMSRAKCLMKDSNSVSYKERNVSLIDQESTSPIGIALHSKEAQKRDHKSDGGTSVHASHPSTDPGFRGFSSASGKALPAPSKEALAKAQVLLTDNLEGDASSFGGFTSASGKSLPKPSKEAVEKAILVLAGDASSESVNPFGGFTSVSGESLPTPSKESLNNARLFMSEEKPVKLNASSFSGFASASGKPLTAPSKQALEKTRLVLAERKTGVTDNEFTGASGNLLPTPSKLPLEKAKKLLVEDSTRDNPAPLLASFTSASGKRLASPSKTAKQRAQFLIQDDPMPISSSIDEPASISGFASAAGTKLAPPTEAGLKRAQTLIDDLVFDLSVANQASLMGNINSTKTVPVSMDLSDVSQLPSAFQTPVRQVSRIVNRSITSSTVTKPLTTRIRSFQSLIKPSDTQQTPNSTNRSRPQFRTPFKKGTVAPSPAATPTKPSLLPTFTPQSMFNLTAKPTRVPLREVFRNMSCFSRDELIERGLPQAILDIDSESAAVYTFQDDRDVSQAPWGYEAAMTDLVRAGGNPALVTPAWTQNHYKWILWKLAGLIRRDPSLLGTHWTKTNVLSQLRYRYEVEINQAKRSCIRLIVERDNVAGTHLILFVSRISCDDNENPVVYLSDGWYEIRANLDAALVNLAKRRKLYLGLKLHLYGAELCGSLEGCPVLQSVDRVSLSIFVNGTRRAKWHERLGYQKAHFGPSGLDSVLVNGGKVASMFVLITRVFPQLYLETQDQGMPIIRTAKEEEFAESNWTKVYQKLYDEALDKVPFDSSNLTTQSESQTSSSGNRVPEGVLEQRIRDYIEERLTTRIVHRQLRLEVVDMNADSKNPKKAVWVIRDVGDDEMKLFQEGKCFHLRNVTVSQPYNMYHNVQCVLRTNDYKLLNVDGNLMAAFEPREIIACDELQYVLPRSLVDIAVFSVGGIRQSKAPFEKNGIERQFIDVICSDQTGQLIKLEVLWPPKVKDLLITSGDVWILKNVEYIGYDPKADLHHLGMNLFTDWNPAKAAIERRVLEDWVLGNKAKLQEMENKANCIFSDY